MDGLKDETKSLVYNNIISNPDFSEDVKTAQNLKDVLSKKVIEIYRQVKEDFVERQLPNDLLSELDLKYSNDESTPKSINS